jgi:hypothetical protein
VNKLLFFFFRSTGWRVGVRRGGKTASADVMSGRKVQYKAFSQAYVEINLSQ